jgi:hypothetical protein
MFRLRQFVDALPRDGVGSRHGRASDLRRFAHGDWRLMSANNHFMRHGNQSARLFPRESTLTSFCVMRAILCAHRASVRAVAKGLLRFSPAAFRPRLKQHSASSKSVGRASPASQDRRKTGRRCLPYSGLSAAAKQHSASSTTVERASPTSRDRRKTGRRCLPYAGLSAAAKQHSASSKL